MRAAQVRDNGPGRQRTEKPVEYLGRITAARKTCDLGMQRTDQGRLWGVRYGLDVVLTTLCSWGEVRRTAQHSKYFS